MFVAINSWVWLKVRIRIHLITSYASNCKTKIRIFWMQKAVTLPIRLLWLQWTHYQKLIRLTRSVRSMSGGLSFHIMDLHLSNRCIYVITKKPCLLAHMYLLILTNDTNTSITFPEAHPINRWIWYSIMRNQIHIQLFVVQRIVFI